MSKLFRFVGVAAHSGGSPHLRINALNAAQIALNAMHAQQETFKDEDAIRDHPIITKAGAIVNVVPAKMAMETYVRGQTTEAFLDVNAKVDKARRTGALAVGAKWKLKHERGHASGE